jgi:hypothetical protein
MNWQLQEGKGRSFEIAWLSWTHGWSDNLLMLGQQALLN